MSFSFNSDDDERSIPDSFRFKNGDRVYLIGAVRPSLERRLKGVISKNNAKVAVIRQR